MHRADDAKALDQERRVRKLALRLRLGLDLWSGLPTREARAEAFPCRIPPDDRAKPPGTRRQKRRWRW